MNLFRVIKSSEAVQKIRPILVFIRTMAVDFSPKLFGKKGHGAIIQLPAHILGAKYIHIGERVSIGSNSYIHAIDNYAGKMYSPQILIGDDVYVGRNCYINAISLIEIQEGCVLSEEVYLADQSHGLDPRGGLIMKQPLTSKGSIVIGAHTFVGLRAVIMPGVSIGHHCVIGTSAVVTRSIPDFSMVVGNPARIIKQYNTDRHEWEDIKYEKND